MTALVVWWLVASAVVPGVVAGATTPLSTAADPLTDVEDARGTSVNATASPGTVAAGVGDSVEITGATTFDSGDVRLYLVGPRGRFLGEDGAAGDMETERVSAGAFAATYDSFTRRGTYRLLVVSPRADGAFASTTTLGRDALPTGVTQRQAVDLVRAAYGGDEVIELSLRGETPRLSIDPVSADGTLVGDDVVTVTGTANRGDGTAVFVDLAGADGRTVTTAEADVDAASGTWAVDLDLAGVEPGSYTLFAADGASRASTTVIVVTKETTPTETPAETPVSAESDAVADARETVENATGAALANGSAGLETANETVEGVSGGNANATASGNANESETNGSVEGETNATAEGAGSTGGAVPGFGVGAFVAALVVVALGVRRRVRQ